MKGYGRPARRSARVTSTRLASHTDLRAADTTGSEGGGGTSATYDGVVDADWCCILVGVPPVSDLIVLRRLQRFGANSGGFNLCCNSKRTIANALTTVAYSFRYKRKGRLKGPAGGVYTVNGGSRQVLR